MSTIVAPMKREVRSPRGLVTLFVDKGQGLVECEDVPELPPCPMPGIHRCEPAVDDYARHLAYVAENPSGDWLYVFNRGQGGWERVFSKNLGCNVKEIRFCPTTGTPKLTVVTERGERHATLFHEWTLS